MEQLPGILAFALTVPFFAKYGLVLVAAILEGPIVFFICGFLVHLGILDIVPAFISLMAGDLIGDTIYYLIGYRYGHSFIRKFGKYVGVTEEKVAKATIIFNKHHEKILIVSKITNGFGLAIAVLITAGMTRLSFVRFFFFNLAGELVWAGLLLSGGYYFGTWYTQIDSWVGRISIGVGLVFVIVLFFQFNRYLSKRAEAIEV